MREIGPKMNNKALVRLFEDAAIKDKFSFSSSSIDKLKQSIIRDFCDFCKDNLGISEMPMVRLVDKKEEGMSTGAYTPSSNSVVVLAGKRAILDVLRSIGHELTHRKQDEDGILENIPKQGNRGKDDMSDVGVDFEDEANARAGALVKQFSRQYGKVPYEKLFDI